MKKLISLLLAILLLVSFTACNPDKKKEPDEKEGTTLVLPDIYVQEIEAGVPQSIIPHDAHYVENLEAYAIDLASKGDLETGIYIVYLNELVFFINMMDGKMISVTHTDRVE